MPYVSPSLLGQVNYKTEDSYFFAIIKAYAPWFGIPLLGVDTA